MLLPEQVSKEAIKLPDKTGDIVARPIKIVVKCSFVLLIVIDVKETQRTQNVFLSPQMFLDWPPESPDNQYHLFK